MQTAELECFLKQLSPIISHRHGFPSVASNSGVALVDQQEASCRFINRKDHNPFIRIRMDSTIHCHSLKLLFQRTAANALKRIIEKLYHGKTTFTNLFKLELLESLESSICLSCSRHLTIEIRAISTKFEKVREQILDPPDGCISLALFH